MVALGPSAAWVPLDESAGGGAEAAATVMAERLRVVTWNVEYRTPAEPLIPALRSLAGDVLLLQEIGPDRQGGADRSARIGAAFGMRWVYAHGLAIVARAPLHDAALMILPQAALPYHRRTRVALAATIATARGPVRLVTVHLDTRLNLAERTAQLAPALADLPPCAIVGGDFNTLPFRFAGGAVPVWPADQAAGLDRGFAAHGFDTPTRDAGRTHRAGFRLDAIYTRGGRAEAVRVATAVRASDHFPLSCDVTIDRSRSTP